jgi:hypothetical protein
MPWPEWGKSESPQNRSYRHPTSTLARGSALDEYTWIPKFLARSARDVPLSDSVVTTIKNLELLAADFAVTVQSAAGLRPLPPEVRASRCRRHP